MTIVSKTALVLMIFFGFSVHAKYVDEPENCFRTKQYPCAVRVLEQSKIEKDQGFYYGQALSQILFENQNKIKIIDGSWLVVLKQSTEITHLALRAELVGVHMLEKQEDKLFLSNINGSVNFTKNNVFNDEALLPGMQNWYGRVLSDHEVARGVIAPIERSSLLKKLYAYGAMALLPKALENQKRSVASVADYYRDTVQATESMHAKAKLERARLEQERRNEAHELRRLYRQKNYLE